jgi:uncharacterized protein (DUF58 family)
LDFADFREYHPGDDYRRIDYLTLARLDILLIKLFEAEDDLNVRVLVDTSASMGRGEKLRIAKKAAAALGFVSLVRRDAVTLYSFPGNAPTTRFVGRAGARPYFAALDRLAAGGQTPMVAAARHVLGRGGPGGLTVLVSDLMSPEWEQAIGRLPARGGEVVVVHVLSAEDLDVDSTGDVDLVDSETGQRVPVSLVPEVRSQYRELATGWVDRVAHAVRRSGARYVRLGPGSEVETALLGDWRAAGVVK